MDKPEIEKKARMGFMMRQMLKQFIPTIKEKMGDANPYIHKMLTEEHQLLQGEERIVFMLTTSTSGEAYIMTVAMAGSEIKRTIKTQKLTDFIEKILTLV